MNQESPCITTVRQTVRALLFGAVSSILLAACGQQNADSPTNASTAAIPNPTDIAGIWWPTSTAASLQPVDRGQIPLNDAGRAAWTQAKKLVSEIANPKDDEDIRRCAPFGVPRTWTQAYPVQIIQRAGLLAIIHEHNNQFRLVYMDQPLPSIDDVDPVFFGNSVGRWQDDRLIIESIGFNTLTVLDDAGLPHSEQLKVTETLRKKSETELKVLATIEDPTFYSSPWTAEVAVLERRDSERIEEFVCGIDIYETRYTRADGSPTASH